MEIEFEIDFVFKKITRHGPHLLARQIDIESDFHLNDSSTLGGFGVKRFGMPRALTKDGNPRFDIFTFTLKDKSEISNFKEGQIVKFVQ